MNRVEFNEIVQAELGKLMKRDLVSFTATECCASWAHELTDMLRQPIIVMPCMNEKREIAIIAYAVPVPVADYPYPPANGPGSPT